MAISPSASLIVLSKSLRCCCSCCSSSVILFFKKGCSASLSLHSSGALAGKPTWVLSGIETTGFCSDIGSVEIGLSLSVGFGVVIGLAGLLTKLALVFFHFFTAFS